VQRHQSAAWQHTRHDDSDASDMEEGSPVERRSPPRGGRRTPTGAGATPGSWSPRPKRRRNPGAADGPDAAAKSLADPAAAYQPAAIRQARADASGAKPAWQADALPAAVNIFARAADAAATPAPMHPGVADLAFSPLAIGSGGRRGGIGGAAAAAERRTPPIRRSGRLAKLARRAAACLGIGRAARRSPLTPAPRPSADAWHAGVFLQPPQPMASSVSPDGFHIPAALYQRVSAHSGANSCTAGPLAAAAATASWAATDGVHGGGPSQAAAATATPARGFAPAEEVTPAPLVPQPTLAAAQALPAGFMAAHTPRQATPAAALAAETARKRASAARRGRPKSVMPRSGGSTGRRSSGAKPVGYAASRFRSPAHGLRTQVLNQ